ncbi:MAG: hypothetical protein IPQ28_12160 [Sphingobacteriales bacterium]|nr:hypothetical protein [Sphingobacteriales bacterium]
MVISCNNSSKQQTTSTTAATTAANPSNTNTTSGAPPVSAGKRSPRRVAMMATAGRHRRNRPQTLIRETGATRKQAPSAIKPQTTRYITPQPKNFLPAPWQPSHHAAFTTGWAPGKYNNNARCRKLRATN